MAKLAVFLVLFACAGVARAQPFHVDSLAWLAGCWQGGSDAREVSEHWMPPAGGMMMGMGRTLVGGRVTTYEFMRIHTEADGAIFFTAKPSGQPEASFRLVLLGGGEAVFEDLSHDFPQRVRYRDEGGGRMRGRIEGTVGGRERSVDFPMQRAACE